MIPQETGMTLRDWFAGQAMIAFLGDKKSRTPAALEKYAIDAYAMADAMMKARERQEAAAGDDTSTADEQSSLGHGLPDDLGEIKQRALDDMDREEFRS